MQRGLVYVIVGFFAVMAALGSGDAVDTRGAVQQLLGQPGAVLLWLVVAGPCGLAPDTRHRRYRPARPRCQGLLVRTGLVSSGVVNLLLALFT